MPNTILSNVNVFHFILRTYEVKKYWDPHFIGEVTRAQNI